MAMVLSRETYLYVVDKLNTRDDVARVAEETNIPCDTLLAIYVQKVTQRLKHVHRNFEEKKDLYYDRFKQGENIVDMALQEQFAPCSLARMILRTFLERQGSPVNNDDIKLRLRNPSLIKDERLRQQVMECIEMDTNNSPLVERIKSFMGSEHELILQEKLYSMNIPFKTERTLRSNKEQHKTPDIYLDMAIVINGRQYWWIESKACFGDEQTFRQHKADQLTDYLTRFNSGIVIYWFGYVKEIDDGKGDILVFDHFPAELIEVQQ